MTYLLHVVVFVVLVNTVLGVNGPEFRTMDPATAAIVKEIKMLAAQKYGITLDVNSITPFLDGDQALDPDTAQAILNSYRKRQGRAATIGGTVDKHWLTMPINYFFNNSAATAAYKSTVYNVVQLIQSQTCITYNELTSTAGITNPYITFGLGAGCVSFVGRSTQSLSSPIYATDSCFRTFGDMVELLVMSLGNWHEHQRNDRDQYVSVISSNVPSENDGDFSIILPPLMDTRGLPYDYTAVTHFPPKKYSSTGGNTMTTLDPLFQNTIGQRVELSFMDAKLLNLVYCANSCTPQQLRGVCLNNGYQDPKACSQCRCPDGFSGQYCGQLAPAVQANCGGELTATHVAQNIVSPGYLSGTYTAGTKCTWRITAPAGNHVKLNFAGNFGVYCADTACQHWVEIRYKGLMSDNGPRFCCQTTPTTVLSSDSNTVMVLFRTNTAVSADQRVGFQLMFSILESPPTTLPPLPPPSSIPPPSDTACGNAVCKNRGICVRSKTGVPTCNCPPMLTGPTCEQGICGGCSIPPGFMNIPCAVPEVPARNCTTLAPSNSGSAYGSRDGSRDGRRRRRNKPSLKPVTTPCMVKFCCANALALSFQNRSVIDTCVVTGVADWEPCSMSCGGCGQQGRYDYQVASSTDPSTGQQYPVYKRTKVDSRPCNTQACNCSQRPMWGRGMYGCTACCPGYTQQGTECVSSG